MLCRERTIKVNAHKADLLPFCAEIIDSLADTFGDRTHGNDHSLCLRVAIIVEQAIFTPCDFRQFLHVFLYHLRDCIVIGIACLAMLEEHIGVFCHASRHRGIRVECAIAECRKSVLVNEMCEIILVDGLDFLNFMRCAESVEEVYKRHTALDG